MHAKLSRLRQIITDMESVLVAFSGGIDSSLVLKVASDTLGSGAVAVTSVSATFPAIELECARRLSAEIEVRHLIIEMDQLEIPEFVRNDAGRCYHCKHGLYQTLDKVRRDLGLAATADGTNLDDLDDDRPGILAAREWAVRSPLLDAGLFKEDVRSLARQMGLSNWDKPAAACLSSRIPHGVTITREALSRVEQAEAVLLQEGFRHIRVRDRGDTARIELATNEIGGLLDPARRVRVTAKLKELGYRFVTLDLDGYRQGGGNR